MWLFICYNQFDHCTAVSNVKVDFLSLRKQSTSRKVATWALAKQCLSNECRNSTLMTCHYPDLGSVSDWLKRNSLKFQVSSFYEGSSGNRAKCWLFSQARISFEWISLLFIYFFFEWISAEHIMSINKPFQFQTLFRFWTKKPLF